MTKKELQAQLAAAQLKAKTATGRNRVAVQKRIANLRNKITNFTATQVLSLIHISEPTRPY